MNAALELEAKVLRYQDAMNSVIDRFESPVQQFYSGAVVFVTGGSGFLGKQLVEKLFRSSKVKRVYVLLRSKKGKTIQDRLDAMLKDPVYEGLRKKQPEFGDRITAVEGNVAELRLALSEEDWTTITDEVDIIFHMAATTRFDDAIKVATLINVRGTREAIRLARECKNLRSFVHVSTAYSHATHGRVGAAVLEELYPSPMPPAAMLQLAETLTREKLDALTPELLHDWPNTYTFTKALAEEVVRTTASELPVCIVRPAVVLHSHSEPAPGWLDTSCMFGPSGVVLGVILGVLHVFLVDNTKRLAMFPVDRTNNAIIAAGWDAGQRQRSEKQIPVYTVADEQCFIKFSFISNTLRGSRHLASNMGVWYCYLVDTATSVVYRALMWALHYIPAYLADGICNVFNMKPKGILSFVKTFKMLDKQTGVFNLFLTQEWLFKNHNTKALFNRMSEDDKHIYNFNLTDIDYKEYVQVWVVGIRKYILKDGLKDTDKAYKKQMYLKYANIIFLCLYVYLLWKIACVGVWGVGWLYGHVF